MALLMSSLLRSAISYDATHALTGETLGGGINGDIFPLLGTPLQPSPELNKPANSLLRNQKQASDSSIHVKGWQATRTSNLEIKLEYIVLLLS